MITSQLNGRVRLSIPRFKTRLGRFFCRMIGMSEQVHVKLDEMGSAVWNEIDGTKTVKKIGQKVSARFQDKAEPLYPRLAEYLARLEKNGFISYRIS